MEECLSNNLFNALSPDFSNGYYLDIAFLKDRLLFFFVVAQRYIHQVVGFYFWFYFSKML